jgi:hypothetical protein
MGDAGPRLAGDEYPLSLHPQESIAHTEVIESLPDE